MAYQLKYKETLPVLFAEAVEKYRNEPAFRIKKDGNWQMWTYGEARDKIELIAMGLRSLGIESGDRIGIQSENRPEWVWSDYAMAHFGIISAAVYPTLLPEQVKFILNDSGAAAVFVSSKEQAEKILQIKPEVPTLKFMIIYDSVSYPDEWILTLDDLLLKGAEFKKGVNYTLEEIGEERQKDEIWTLIYTSGTTGNPKGVMLTHFNIASNVQAIQSTVNFLDKKRWLSFLPLSHSLERAGSHFTFWLGSDTWYAENILKVPENLQDCKPHYLISVPRLYEKIYAKVLEGVRTAKPAKKKIVNWAMGVGKEASINYLQKAKMPGGVLGLKYKLANKLVFSKLNKVFGGEFIFGISGGAPLPQAIGEFFASSGILILEGFGLTETTPVTNVNPIDNIKFGYVGPTIIDVEMKIAEDGEILFRGPNIMKGYWNNPDATAEVIEADGWFHTGDIGIIDQDGFLKITDRKKNLIVTSGGKNIAPANIENKLLQSRYIDQLVVIGDRRNYLVAAVVPSQEVIENTAKEGNFFTEDYEALLKDDRIKKLIEDDIDRLQTEFARYEQVKKFFLVSKAFTIEGGELTPSLKVKRKVVEQLYADQLDALYTD
ncbi:MAG TPA: long-chain fatty acid--CoA ligase [Candidatus Marinimicrobia bacterium]|nr:long-chain fatty acid--CoA ligase [Candidatus Neomarinimicrobiota bacterium]